MPLKFPLKTILFERETVYGTDPTPLAADAAVMYDVEFEREVTYAQLKRVLPWLARTERRTAHVFSHLRGWVELSGGGAAGTAPAYKSMLRTSSFAEVVNGVVDVQYNPVSTGDESGTWYFYHENQRHRANGSRGMLTGLEFVTGEVPKGRFDFIGLPVAPDDSAPVTPDFTTWRQALVVNKVNTPTCTLHSFAAVVQSLTINMGTVLTQRDWVNTKDVVSVDREPSGQIVIEAPTLAAKNYFAIADADTQAPLQLVHGIVAGNIFQVDAPKVQCINPRYGNAGGVVTLTMDLDLHPNVGNDEIKLTVK